MELTEQKHKVEWLNGSSNFSEGVQPRKEQLDMVEFCRDSIIAKKKKVMMISFSSLALCELPTTTWLRLVL